MPGVVMFSRFARPLTIASCVVVIAGAPAFAADYGGGCDFGCGDTSVGYDYSNPGAVSNYFISDNDPSAADPNENFALRGSIGVASITANEKVFASTTGEALVSRLDWTSQAPIASLDARARFGDGWTLRGHLDAAAGGDSSMTDYDWLAGYSEANWTHRSISPNTSLDWYLNGSAAVGRDFPINDAFSVNVNGGLKYSDMQWTAVGGSFIYSTGGGFRNDIGTFADSPVIRFHVRLPVAFAGVDTSIKDGRWSLDTTAKYGLTFLASDTDYHYLRDLRFEDQLNWAQDFTADARVGYAFNDHLSAFLEGSYERLLSGHGDTDQYLISTGAQTAHFTKDAGIDLQVATIKAGLKGNF